MIFNQSLENLPKNLLFLKVGWNFNQPLTKMPENLRRLEFGRYFNQNIQNNILPKTL